MSHRLITSIAAAVAVMTVPATAQIATSNEKGATGAYSPDVDSSFTSEGRYGPRTALDDLRADVDRDREQIERIRQQQIERTEPPEEPIEPYSVTTEGDADVENTQAEGDLPEGQ